jgi:hypothetical protein
VLLGPGESTDVERVFAVPPGAGNLGLVVRFGALAGFPGSLVIGENGWLHKPDRIVLGL